MKRSFPILGAVLLLALAGCGQNKAALAKQTVHTYWSDIGKGQMKQAYGILSSGTRAARPFKQFRQDMFGFLINLASVSAKTGSPSIKGSRAVVPVTLTSPKTTAKLHAYQHLYWENGGWRIIDANGGLSQHR